MLNPLRLSPPYEQVQVNTLSRVPSYHSFQGSKATAVEARQIDDEYDGVDGAKISTFQGGSSWTTLRNIAGWRAQGYIDKSSHWKPTTLRLPILGAFILVSISIIVILEILIYISSSFKTGNSSGGGLAFAADINSLSVLSTFGYLYLPTVISVLYSMLWSWVDLDVKRLEPWFQLSKANGASAKDSLLLQYPFDFLPFIPITAARRRHWGVFLAGSIMLIIFWVVTPLQSAMFNTGTVVRTINTTISTSAGLIPVESQIASLNANFLNTAYGIAWLNQKLPPFTTKEMAFLPFQPQPQIADPLPSESWSTKVDAYSTNLTCTPAIVTPRKDLTYTFDNGRGCSVSGIGLVNTGGAGNFMVVYIGYYNDAQVDWSLQNRNCTAEHSNNFLAIWASSASMVQSGVFTNMTAQFCVPTYSVQETYVKVNASSTHAVVSYGPGASTNKAVSDVFNITNFEYIVGTGVTSTLQRRDYPDRSVVEQYPRLKEYNLTWPVSNMVGFAIALNPKSIEDLVDPASMQQAFQNAHQLLFISAFSTLTEKARRNTTEDLRYGEREDKPGAIIIVPIITRIVETALGIISLLIAILWNYTKGRQSNLSKDPASIADVMSLIGPEYGLSPSTFKDNGTLGATELSKQFIHQKLLLKESPGSSMSPFIVIVSPRSVDSPQDQCSIVQPVSSETNFTPVRPFELGLPAGFVFIGIILGALVGLVILNQWSLVKGGIELPSKSPIVLSIIENYLPTAFATLLEPAWVILNRLLCLLQPFDELRKGHAKASASVDAKYTSLPPPLVVWRAFRSGHIILAIVCIATVSTNILAVSLSALLVERNSLIDLTISTAPEFLPSFGTVKIFDQQAVGAPITYYDHFYVARSNLTDGTPLPVWVDLEFSYLPFALHAPATTPISETSSGLQAFRVSTTGFGADVDCKELSSGSGDNMVVFEPAQNGSQILFYTNHTINGQETISCVPSGVSNGFNSTSINTQAFPDGNSALEVMNRMAAANNAEDGGFCPSIIVAGWVRLGAEGSISPELSNLSLNRTLDATFIMCTPSLSAATFDVTVDTEGHVVSSNQTSNFSTNLGHYFANDTSPSALIQQSNGLMTPPNVKGALQWHNDSFTSDWINSLLGNTIGSTRLIDPSAPAPDSNEVQELMRVTYRRLFAILLGLNTHVFTEALANDSLLGVAVINESRIFVSSLMFQITAAMLGFHLLVAIWYYVRRPRRFLPRMPTSIASLLGFVAFSRARRDFGSEKLDEKQLYGYGRFIGVYGNTHVGIERQRYVVPLETRDPAFRKRRFWHRRNDQDASQPKSWI